MRMILATVPILLALAACGTENVPYEKSDGTFDRDAYRTVMTETCRAGIASSDLAPSPEERDRICTCVSDRVLAADDDALRAQLRDRAQDDAAQAEAFSYCIRPESAGSVATDDEAPPPEEPPPPPVAGSEPGPPLVPGTVRARARANLVSYISADDYPVAALRDGQQGRVTVALDVGPDGRVSACRVTQSSGFAALDSATCRILRSRARYTPARDAQGAAVADRDQATVRWALPPE